MKQYHDYLKYILENGIKKDDRTGTGTISIFGYQMRFDLSKGFPLVTTKKLHFKSIAYELLWFLSGDTNIKFLNDNGVKIWDSWALKEDNTKKIRLSDHERYKLYLSMNEDKWENIKDEFDCLSIEEGHKVMDLKGVPREKENKLNLKGDLGSIYSAQWRSWKTPDFKTIDQISNVINQIKTNPDSRRIIVSAWNVADLPDENLTPQENVKQGKMALAPCHVMFQFYVKPLNVFERILYVDNNIWDYLWKKNNLGSWHDFASEDYKKEWIEKATKVLDDYGIKKSALSCMLTQRSCDSFLGLPYNIASYSLLTHMIAQQCNLEVGEFIWSGGDCHIYLNHLEQVKEQLSRNPYDLPTLNINRKPDSIFNYKYEDFEIVNYQTYPHIKGVVAV